MKKSSIDNHKIIFEDKIVPRGVREEVGQSPNSVNEITNSMHKKLVIIL